MRRPSEFIYPISAAPSLLLYHAPAQPRPFSLTPSTSSAQAVRPGARRVAVGRRSSFTIESGHHLQRAHPNLELRRPSHSRPVPPRHSRAMPVRPPPFLSFLALMLHSATLGHGDGQCSVKKWSMKKENKLPLLFILVHSSYLKIHSK
jgi:hypothetical protein